MLTNAFPFLLIALEMTFIFVGLGILHSQRRSIGTAAFYISLGLLLLFSQLIGAMELQALLAPGVEFPVAPLVLVLPYLAAMLMVYASDGTAAAQRLIIGSVVAFGFFLYLGELTRLQCFWRGFSISPEISAETLDAILLRSRRGLVTLEFALVLDLLLLPILFTRLRNYGCSLGICVLGALIGTQTVDLLVNWALTPESPLTGNLIARLFGTFWLGALLTVYLSRIEREADPHSRRTLDIIFAFLGSYGRARVLEQDLREWEGRYRLLLDNASELILMLGTDGRVLDANPAAIRLLTPRGKIEDILGKELFPRLSEPDATPLDDDFGSGRLRDTGNPQLLLDGGPRRGGRVLSCSINRVEARGRALLTLIGRDVTQELAMDEEQKRLSEELAHSQRLEALGRLAGGVAHDFNNHLHAIMGHLDSIEYNCEFDNPEVENHLEKIGLIADQCGKLTSQLLGYARKGKYQVTDLDLCKILRDSADLLHPGVRKNVQLALRLPPGPLPVRGDLLQLQQVFLNLIINALDAMAGNTAAPVLDISAGNAVDLGEPLMNPREPDREPRAADFCYAEIRDNGPGIPPELQTKIFEPFFTTKPVGQGTGMGLSMVYGAVVHHHGWVQLQSEPGQGSSFRVFLPISGTPQTEERDKS